MSSLTCCQTTVDAAGDGSIKTADGRAHPSSGKQRGFALAKFSLPTLILALLPKCPACFAAYIALGGISVSVQAASVFRSTLVAICVAALVVALVSGFRSALMGRLRPHSQLY